MLALFVFNTTNMFAQVTNETGLPGDDLVYYEDMRYDKGASGYTDFIVAAHSVPKRINDGASITYIRPANNYPAGDPIDNKNWSVACNSKTENYEVDVWFVVNSIDLSAYDNGKKYFTINSITKYFEDGGDNTNDKNVTFWYATNFSTGDDPTKVTWTSLPVPETKPVFGKDGKWITSTFDLSAVACGKSFAIAVRVQTSADGPNPSETDFNSASNRNGTINLSDIIYTGTKQSLGVDDVNFNKNFSVYPNPATNVLNISSLNNLKVKNVSLVDYSGKSVYTNTNVDAIDVSEFSKGIYILRIESQGGDVLAKKVILE